MRLRIGLALLSATTCLTSIAVAQTAPAPNPAATAPAQAPVASKGVGNNVTLGSLPIDVKSQTEDVTVVGIRNSVQTALGGGLLIAHQDAPKSVSTVTQAYIQQQNPASNPFQRACRSTMSAVLRSTRRRSFDSENIARISLEQGSADLDTPIRVPVAAPSTSTWSTRRRPPAALPMPPTDPAARRAASCVSIAA